CKLATANRKLRSPSHEMLRIVDGEALLAEEPREPVAKLASGPHGPRIAERQGGLRRATPVAHGDQTLAVPERRERLLELRDELRSERLAVPVDLQAARVLLDRLVDGADAPRGHSPGAQEIVVAQLPVDDEHGVARDQVLRVRE